eukprot:715552-Ditylum_brightwellii.AAC.1
MSNQRHSQFCPQNNPKQATSPKQQQKHNNHLLCASTGTSRTPSFHQHCHHGNAAPLLDTAATALAPKPGHGTNDTGGL